MNDKDFEKRRRFPRVEVRIPAVVCLEGGDEIVGAEIRNISEGGAFICTPTPIAFTGQRIFVKFQISDTDVRFGGQVVGSDPFQFQISTDSMEQSVVCWAQSGRDNGFGIEFVCLSLTMRQAIAALVKQAGEAALGSDPEAGPE